MADPELLARLDRIALLLVALLAVELLELFDVDVLSLVFFGIVASVIGFAYLWGKSVVGLLLGEGI